MGDAGWGRSGVPDTAEDVISGIDLQATTVAKRTITMIKADAMTTTIGTVIPFFSAKTPQTSSEREGPP